MAVRIREELNIHSWIAARIPAMLHGQQFQLLFGRFRALIENAKLRHRIYFYFHTPAIVREGVGQKWGNPLKKLFTILFTAFFAIGCVSPEESVRRMEADRQARMRARAPEMEKIAMEEFHREVEAQKMRAEQVEAFILSHDKITDTQKQALRESKVQIGMPETMVEFSWGRPHQKNDSVGPWGKHSQWVYGSTYLYFENGVLRSFQQSTVP